MLPGILGGSWQGLRDRGRSWCSVVKSTVGKLQRKQQLAVATQLWSVDTMNVKREMSQQLSVISVIVCLIAMA